MSDDNGFGFEGTFSDYLVHEWLEEVQESCWVSLHFDSPAIAGALASEFGGGSGGYHRQEAKFTNPSNRAIWNKNALQWRGLNDNNVMYVGGWDKERGGHLLWYAKLESPKMIREGQGYTLAENELVISFA